MTAWKNKLAEGNQDPNWTWLDSACDDFEHYTQRNWYGKAFVANGGGATAVVTAKGVAIEFMVYQAVPGNGVWVVANADAPDGVLSVKVWSFERDGKWLGGRTDRGVADFAYRMGEFVTRMAAEDVDSNYR